MPTGTDTDRSPKSIASCHHYIKDIIKDILITSRLIYILILEGRNSPYYGDMWRTYCCLTTFFPIVDTCLSCEDIARQSCAMVPDGDFWRLFCVLCFQRASCSRFQTCVLNSHYGHTMCGSMADIQSAAAEIRRGKKKKEERPNHSMEIYMVCPIP